MRVRIVDAAPLDAETVRRTRDGYLVADAKIARVGIQTYSGREIDPENAHGMRDKAVIRVYRGEDQVFNTDSMASLAHRPITIDHPVEMVTAKNWSKYSVGDTGGEVARDGDFIRVPLKVMDQRGIDAIEGGKRELSVGYFCDLDFTPGTSPKGEAYDARQVGIVGNHLAICDRARAGSSCRIPLGDSWEPREDAPIPTKDQTMKTIMIDGVPVADVSPAAEAVISTLQGRITAATTAKDAAEGQVATLTTQAAAKDAEIATLKQSLADAKVTPQQLRDHAKAFAKTLADAKILAPSLTISDAMDEAAIRKAVVSSKLGDAAKDWNDAQIEVSFATMAGGISDSQRQAAPSNPLADAIGAGAGAVTNDAVAAAEKARNARFARFADAHTGAAA